MKKRNVFVLGALLGAAAVALLTPKSGKEMQKDLLKTIDDVQTKIKEIEVEEVKQSFIAKLEEVKELVDNFDWEASKADLENKVNDLKEKLNEMLDRVEEVKESAQEEAQHLQDEIEEDFTIVIDTVKDATKDVVDTVKDVVVDVADQTKSTATEVVDAAKEAAVDVMDQMTKSEKNQ